LRNWTIEKCFDVLLKEAKASLNRTPDLLPVLKEVGVVDSANLVQLFHLIIHLIHELQLKLYLQLVS